MKGRKIFLLSVVATLISSSGANLVCAQQVLTKQQLVGKANLLFESGRAREAIGLINQ